MSKEENFIEFLKAIKKHYSKKNTIRLAAEGWDSNFKILVSVMLSAQTLDKTTIKVCEKLFKKFDTPKKMSKANFDEILKIIRSVNYSKTKAKNLILTSEKLVKKHNSKVPNTLDDLMELNGVGIKTANLVLGECFKIPAICVDTHVHRICNIFGFVNTKTPEKTLEKLEKLVSKKYWLDINRYLVRIGQEVKGYDRKKFEDFLINK